MNPLILIIGAAALLFFAMRPKDDELTRRLGGTTRRGGEGTPVDPSYGGAGQVDYGPEAREAGGEATTGGREGGGDGGFTVGPPPAPMPGGTELTKEVLDAAAAGGEPYDMVYVPTDEKTAGLVAEEGDDEDAEYARLWGWTE